MPIDDETELHHPTFAEISEMHRQRAVKFLAISCARMVEYLAKPASDITAGRSDARVLAASRRETAAQLERI